MPHMCQWLLTCVRQLATAQGAQCMDFMHTTSCGQLQVLSCKVVVRASTCAVLCAQGQP
jgi:hypothetical protein